MNVERESQIPSLMRAPGWPAAPAPTPAAARRKKRAVTFTNRLDPELLDWMAGYKDQVDTTIAAILDEALRDYIEKITGVRPQL